MPSTSRRGRAGQPAAAGPAIATPSAAQYASSTTQLAKKARNRHITLFALTWIVLCSAPPRSACARGAPLKTGSARRAQMRARRSPFRDFSRRSDVPVVVRDRLGGEEVVLQLLG